MSWDSTRPVPWQRLIRDWLIYVGVMLVVFLIAYRDRLSLGVVAGLLISGPLFVLLGGVLAKFGYQRTRLSQVSATARRRGEAPAPESTTASAGPRNRPAPTRRTAAGPRRATKRRR